MKFTIPRVNVIESDTGFQVELLGRTGLEYREGSKTLFVDAEILVHGIAIYSGSIKDWKEPYSEEIISSEKKQEILSNIEKAYSWRNESVKIY